MRRVLVAVVLALALAAPWAQSQAPASGARSLALGSQAGREGRVYYWTSATADGPATGDLVAGDDAFAHVDVRIDDVAPNATRSYFVNLSGAGLELRPANLTLLNATAANATGAPVFVELNATLHVSANASGLLALQVNATLVETPPGGASPTSLSDAGAWPLQVSAIQAPLPAPAVPTWGYALGAVLLVLVAGVVAYSVRERSLRRRMRGATRSQALREEKLEQIAEKRPEQAAAIHQEIRQQEQVREKRRELQILEAKRADVVKGMDLLKKRLDLGALSKLQYDSMLAKRQAELERIDAEIAAMRAEDGPGGSAAA